MWASVTPWLVMDAVCVCINHDYLCRMYILIEVTKVISVYILPILRVCELWQ